jgi:hypothetical protein
MTTSCPGETSMDEPGTPRNCITPLTGMMTVSAYGPVHVMDEAGRKRHLVENHTLGACERFAEQVAVDLMASDVPPGEYLWLDLLDVEQPCL